MLHGAGAVNGFGGMAGAETACAVAGCPMNSWTDAAPGWFGIGIAGIG
jgi:hypothetical protein